ncbi:MAG: hypothetical protein MPJ51_11950, partial [Ruegeria sp.]|nr:hypothetical protein [Ruegeria sp.]
MTETLLSVSEVLLFGRVIEDIEFVPLESKKFIAAAASTDKVSDFKGTSAIDGQAINAKDHVLVAVPKKDNPNAFKTNGLYYVNDDANNTWTRLILPKGALVKVPNGNNNSGVWRQKKSSASKQKFVNIERKKNGAKRQGLGNNRHLDSQLDEDAHFARIYG